MRRRRRALPRLRRQVANQAIVRRLTALPAYRRARTLALYWPADGEADVRALAVHARARGKRVYLPAVGHAGKMHFAPWPRGARLRRNRYGIPEPVGGRRASAALLDLVLMPLVAFDRQGNRLGMGGGYYDRALAARRRRPMRIGVAFALQEAAAIPAQPWDVPVEAVITEHGRRACRRTRAIPGSTCQGAGR